MSCPCGAAILYWFLTDPGVAVIAWAHRCLHTPQVCRQPFTLLWHTREVSDDVSRFASFRVKRHIPGFTYGLHGLYHVAGWKPEELLELCRYFFVSCVFYSCIAQSNCTTTYVNPFNTAVVPTWDKTLTFRDRGYGRGGTLIFVGVFEPLARVALYLTDEDGLGTCFSAA